jgi:hypothetical protein
MNTLNNVIKWFDTLNRKNLLVIEYGDRIVLKTFQILFRKKLKLTIVQNQKIYSHKYLSSLVVGLFVMQ